MDSKKSGADDGLCDSQTGHNQYENTREGEEATQLFLVNQKCVSDKNEWHIQEIDLHPQNAIENTCGAGLNTCGNPNQMNISSAIRKGMRNFSVFLSRRERKNE
jgi:hypothetical protein